MQKKIIRQRIRQRLAACILTGLLAAALCGPHRTLPCAAGAWWGVLYPQFCCTAQEDSAEDGESAPAEGEAPRVKIKFRWLHGF